MNDFLTKMTQHVSVRDFADEPLTAETKAQLLQAARSGSSSNFVQAFSIIEIKEVSLRERLAEISNSASYVKKSGAFYVFVADLYRQAFLLEQAGRGTQGIANMEALLVATVDTALAAENMALAAEALDLGICYIGGIRNEIEEVAQLLGLPPFTVPLFGLTIGKPLRKNEPKPRLPLANQFAVDGYDVAAFTDLREYEGLTQQYYGQRGSNQQQASWPHKMTSFLAEPRRPEVATFLRKQGFSLD